MVVRSNDGHITSYIGTATDIHDQQLAEDKARAAEVYLKSVISNFPVLVMVTDHTVGNYTPIRDRATKKVRPEISR